MEVQLIVKRGKTTSDALMVRRFPTLIGRHRECNLRIAARQVSRRHCVLKVRNGWLHVCDLESCNGTLVNGQPIRGESILRPTDLLEVGPVVFQVAYELPATETPSPSGDTVVLRSTKVDVAPVELASDSAYEISERLAELDREKERDSLDTHRSSDKPPSDSDSGESKIVVLDDGAASESGVSPTRRLLSSQLASRHARGGDSA